MLGDIYIYTRNVNTELHCFPYNCPSSFNLILYQLWFGFRLIIVMCFHIKSICVQHKGLKFLTCAAVGTFTGERRHAVVTGGSVVAGGTGAVVDILTAVVAGPAVHTDTLVAAVGVVARAAVLAGVWHQLALVNVLCAELACGRGQRIGGV